MQPSKYQGLNKVLMATTPTIQLKNFSFDSLSALLIVWSRSALARVQGFVVQSRIMNFILGGRRAVRFSLVLKS